MAYYLLQIVWLGIEQASFDLHQPKGYMCSFFMPINLTDMNEAMLLICYIMI